MDNIIRWSREYDSRVRNVESLSRGSGAKYLRCLVAHNGDYIAASWHRREPKQEQGYVIFSFNS